jgi:hypothetical protein
MFLSKLKGLGAHFAAVLATEAFSSLVDDVLFPFAIARFGFATGGIGVATFAILTNYLLVFWYRRTERDWYGFEKVRLHELKEAEENGPFMRRAKNSRIRTFVFLSIKDPFLGFTYLEGRKIHGMKFDSKDWSVFFLANVIGISFWLVLLGSTAQWIGNWAVYIFGLYGILTVFRKILKTKYGSSK